MDPEEFGEFNPFKLFKEKELVSKPVEDDDSSPVAKLTPDEFFSLLEMPEKMAGRKRTHEDKESESSYEIPEKELTDS